MYLCTPLNSGIHPIPLRSALSVCSVFTLCVFVQMLQLALRQQQLHAAHMQIKLQHQSNLVAGEHNLQHTQHHHQQQHQQPQQQRATSFGSPADELNVVLCPNATNAAWRTRDEPHTTMSPNTHTAATTVEQQPLQPTTQVRMT